MAFAHPHKLDIKRTHKHDGERFSDVPYVRDRRGRIIYRWDAFYSDCHDPLNQRKRDIWELVECLEEQRKRERHTQEQIACKGKERQRHLEKSTSA